MRIRPLPELSALWHLRRGGDPVTLMHKRNAAFQEAVSNAALAKCDAVIGFDTSSWQLAERCAKSGKVFYLDRTIAHPAVLDRLMLDFARKYPDWAGALAPRPACVVEAEKTEHVLAQRIVVGGSFARDTLVTEGISADRIVVNPYGVDWEKFSAPVTVPPNHPLRFLYAGSVTARKGVPVLLDAWRAFAPCDAELWIAGSIRAHERTLIPDLPGLRLLEQVSHAKMAEVYANCDVFVLPSLFEGFGLVILEALASGLPVISTPHTGAIEALTELTLGRIVPVASVDALVEAMRHYRDNPPRREVVAAVAVDALRDRFSWKSYGDRWAALLHETA
jgi:starch synthase